MCRYLLALLTGFMVVLSPLALGEEEVDVTVKDEKERALWVAYIFRREDKGPQVKKLRVPVTRTPVYLVPHGPIVRPLVNIKFEYPLENGQRLFVGNKKIEMLEDSTKGTHKGNVFIYLNSTINDLTVSLRDEKGKILESESVYVFSPEARGMQLTSPFRSIYFRLGSAWLFYGQSSYGTFAANSLAVGLRYKSPEKGQRLGFLGDFDLTVLTYSSTPEDLNPQFFEAMLALTKRSHLIPSSLWRSRWIFGATTVGVYAFGSPFGFSGLYGPTLGYMTEFYLNNKSSLGFSAQHTFYSEKALLVDDDFTWELEANFIYRKENLTQLIFGVSYSNSEFTAGTEKIDLELALFTFSFSL